MVRPWLTVLTLAPGCGSGTVSIEGVDTGAVGTQDSAPAEDTAPPVDTHSPTDTGSRDTATPADTATPPDTAPPPDTGGPEDPQECVDFEHGQLVDVGYAGSVVVLGDGAVLAIVTEGDDFSGLTGETGIDLPEDRSLAMRSSDAGDPGTVAIATLDVFTVVEPDLSWSQLSEVDDRGIVFAVDVLSPESTVLASAMIPVLTGGHRPGLSDGDDAIEDFPEIAVGEGVPGAFVRQAIDLTPWTGIDVKVRFYQHTLKDGHGFFTLLDDLCPGTADPTAERIVLGEPSDRW